MQVISTALYPSGSLFEDPKLKDSWLHCQGYQQVVSLIFIDITSHSCVVPSLYFVCNVSLSLRRVTESLTEISCTAQNKWKCLLLKWLSVGSVERAVQSHNPKDKDCGQSYYPSMTCKYAGFKILTENKGDSYFTKFEISIFACSLVHWFSNCFRFCCMTFPSNVDTFGQRRLESHSNY